MSNPPSNFSWPDLLSPDPDHAARAANALYSHGLSAETFADPEAAHALAQSVTAGNRTAASILLLGYAPSTAPLLHKLIREHGGDAVKLQSWSRIVPLRVAASVALSRLGDSIARRSLLENAESYPQNVRVFLLDVLPYLDAPEVLHAVSNYLRDASAIPEGVPSGAAQRRLCDHAVDAFIDRFRFPVSFPRNPGGRYKPEEI